MSFVIYNTVRDQFLGSDDRLESFFFTALPIKAYKFNSAEEASTYLFEDGEEVQEAPVVDRIAMIRAAAEKVMFEKKVKEALKPSRRAARSYRKTKSPIDLEKEFNPSVVEKMDENYNQWTDSSKYTGEHYGSKVEEARESDKWNSDY